jgi:hypothetical protein
LNIQTAKTRSFLNSDEDVEPDMWKLPIIPKETWSEAYSTIWPSEIRSHNFNLEIITFEIWLSLGGEPLADTLRCNLPKTPPVRITPLDRPSCCNHLVIRITSQLKTHSGITEYKKDTFCKLISFLNIPVTFVRLVHFLDFVHNSMLDTQISVWKTEWAKIRNSKAFFHFPVYQLQSRTIWIYHNKW